LFYSSVPAEAVTIAILNLRLIPQFMLAYEQKSYIFSTTKNVLWFLQWRHLVNASKTVQRAPTTYNFSN